MTTNTQDMITGFILLVLSVAWCAIVLMTIPPGAGGGDVGPRAFPLWLGVALGVMAVIMLARAWIARTSLDPQPREAGAKVSPSDKQTELLMIFLTFGLLMLYGAALPLIGFNLATGLVVALTLVLCLRVSSVFVITYMTVGIPLGCWLVFGKLLHIPLATGGWINMG